MLSGFKNLSELYLLNNQISDISSLAGLTNLTVINLKNNNIRDIKPLANLKKLTYLDLSDNQISAADIKWLKTQLPKCRIDS